MEAWYGFLQFCLQLHIKQLTPVDASLKPAEMLHSEKRGHAVFSSVVFIFIKTKTYNNQKYSLLLEFYPFQEDQQHE